MRDSGEYLFTSELVSEGHPDKVADRISDTVLDAYLTADPYARVACETLVTTNRIVLAGETRGPGQRHARISRRISRARRCRTSATTRPASPGRMPSSSAICTRNPPISPWAWTPPATRMRAPATRASCSAMPAARPTALMPAPIHYAHLILRRISELRRSRRQAGRRSAARRQEPGHAALCGRQAGGRHQHRRLHPARRGPRARAEIKRHVVAA